MPVWEIFRTTYGFVLGRIGQFFAIAWLFLVALVVLFFLEDALSMHSPMWTILQVMIEAHFALLWHRYFLLGREYANPRGVPEQCSSEEKEVFKKLSNRFIWRSVGLAMFLLLMVLFTALPLAIFGSATYGFESDGDAFLVFFMIIVMGVFATVGLPIVRILPMFPALATGNSEASIRDAWELSRGYGTRMVICFLTIVAPIVIAQFSLGFLAGQFYSLDSITPYLGSLFANIAFAIINILGLAIGVTANSEIYRRLTGFDAAAMRQENASNPTPSRRT